MCTYNAISSHTDHFEIQKKDSEESLLTFVEVFAKHKVHLVPTQLLKSTTHALIISCYPLIDAELMKFVASKCIVAQEVR